MGLCILLYGSLSSHKEDTVAQEIMTQTFPQEAAALPGSSPTELPNAWSIIRWQRIIDQAFGMSLSSRNGHIKIGFCYSTLVALLNIDFWAWDKPTTFGPDSCFTGLLEAWTLPSMIAKPIPRICLRTLENIEKNKRFDLLRLKQKKTSSKTRIRMLRRSVGAILAKKYHHRVSSPLLRMLLHPSVEPKRTIKHSENPSQTPHEI